MSFLRRVAGLRLRDRVRSSDIQERLRVEPLLLHMERSQLRWFGHLVRMPPGRLPGEVFRAYPPRRRPRGRPRTHLRDYISLLDRERLSVHPEELEEVAGERSVWISLLRLLPHDTDPDKQQKMNERMIQFDVMANSWNLQIIYRYNLYNPSAQWNRKHFNNMWNTFSLWETFRNLHFRQQYIKTNTSMSTETHLQRAEQFHESCNKFINGTIWWKRFKDSWMWPESDWVRGHLFYFGGKTLGREFMLPECCFVGFMEPDQGPSTQGTSKQL